MTEKYKPIFVGEKKALLTLFFCVNIDGVVEFQIRIQSALDPDPDLKFFMIRKILNFGNFFKCNLRGV